MAGNITVFEILPATIQKHRVLPSEKATVTKHYPITIDAVRNEISLDLPAREIRARGKKWKPRKPRETRGVLAKYARLVNSASLGAVTDANL